MLLNFVFIVEDKLQLVQLKGQYDHAHLVGHFCITLLWQVFHVWCTLPTTHLPLSLFPSHSFNEYIYLTFNPFNFVYCVCLLCSVCKDDIQELYYSLYTVPSSQREHKNCTASQKHCCMLYASSGLSSFLPSWQKRVGPTDYTKILLGVKVCVKWPAMDQHSIQKEFLNLMHIVLLKGFRFHNEQDKVIRIN